MNLRNPIIFTALLILLGGAILVWAVFNKKGTNQKNLPVAFQRARHRRKADGPISASQPQKKQIGGIHGILGQVTDQKRTAQADRPHLGKTRRASPPERRAEGGGDGRLENGSTEALEAAFYGSPDHLDQLDQLDIPSLIDVVKDHDLPQEVSKMAFRLLMGRVYNIEDRSSALNILIEIKDDLAGEDQQSVLKSLPGFADLGGNEVIMDTFFNPPEGISDLDRFRMLTYLNPMHPLGGKAVDSLVDTYFKEQDGRLRQAAIKTLGTVCGDEGVLKVIDLLKSSSTREEQVMLLQILEQSSSVAATDPLKQLLENEKDQSYKEILRQTINKLENKDIHG